jgi:hypothetical protein
MFPSVVMGGEELDMVEAETTMIAVVSTTSPTVPQNQLFR